MGLDSWIIHLALVVAYRTAKYGFTIFHRCPFDTLGWRGHTPTKGAPFPTDRPGDPWALSSSITGHISIRENVPPPFREEERLRGLNPGQTALIDLLVSLRHDTLKRVPLTEVLFVCRLLLRRRGIICLCIAAARLTLRLGTLTTRFICHWPFCHCTLPLPHE